MEDRPELHLAAGLATPGGTSMPAGSAGVAKVPKSD